jgi:glycosyltransferase involved in cell wall biosynthesis
VNPKPPRIAAILPAYNEAGRVADVLAAVSRAPSVDQVVVVNDGSTDSTAARVLESPDVYLLSLPRNQGKGAAMAAGARFTDADVLLFLDADLIGLTPEHVERLVEPVKNGRAQMAVGRFCGGRYWTDLSQRIAPSVSGQRAIAREVFDQIPFVSSARYGVEMLITRFCRYYRIPTVAISLRGVTHPMKEEKLGMLRGWASRGRMYGQILRFMLDPRAPRRSPSRVPRLLKSLTGRVRHGGDGLGLLARLNGKRVARSKSVGPRDPH